MTGKREGDTDEIARAQVHASAKSNLQVPKASWSDFCQHYSKWKNLSILIGTAGSWFCLDVAFYGLSLNNGTILKVIGYSSKDANNMYEFLYNTAVGNIIIVLAGAVPGYWVSVATIDTLGRKTIQLGGFIILTILFIVSCCRGWWFTTLTCLGHGLRLQPYLLQRSPRYLRPCPVLLQLRYVFIPSTNKRILTTTGPNTTTFIVPGEVFPTRYRSTSHGISAASGKIGSIIGQGAISILRTHGATDKNEAPWMDHVLEIYALFMLLGIFTTLLIPETARKTLEELSGEDDYANNPETTIDSEAHAGKNEGTSV